jgi:hypothetical protein
VRRPPAVGVVEVDARGPKGRDPLGPHSGGAVHLGSSSSGSSRGPRAACGVGAGASGAAPLGPPRPPVCFGGVLLLREGEADPHWPHCGSAEAFALTWRRRRVRAMSDCIVNVSLLLGVCDESFLCSFSSRYEYVP